MSQQRSAVTGLALRNNPELIDLGGLAGLTRVGSLRITGNAALADLSGLSALGTIEGDLLIAPETDNFSGGRSWTAVEFPNAALRSLRGLGDITRVEGSVTISGNPSLIDLAGLDRLTTIGVDLNIGLDDPFCVEDCPPPQRNASLATLHGLAAACLPLP